MADKSKYNKYGKTYNGLTIVGLTTGESDFITTKGVIKWGCIDENNNEIIPCMYDLFNDFADNVAIVGKGDYYLEDKDCAVCFSGKMGCVDITGKEIVPVGKYKKIGSDDEKGILYFTQAFSDGVMTVCDWGNRWGFIENIGTEIIPCKYDYVDFYPHEVKKEIFAPAYPFATGTARVRIGDKWFCIDKKGNVLRELTQFDNL